MDLYHIWCDLRPGQRDVEFAEHVGRYLGKLEADGLIADFRLTRRKLGFGVPGLGEFHVIIETQDLAQLDRAFQAVSSRTDPVERFHAAVNFARREFSGGALPRLSRSASADRRGEVLTLTILRTPHLQ